MRWYNDAEESSTKQDIRRLYGIGIAERTSEGQMDLATIIGFIAGIAVLLSGMYSDLGAFVDMPSVILTMGGGLVSTILSVSLEEFLRIPKLVAMVFKNSTYNTLQTIKIMVDMSQRARRDGLLALETAGDETKDEFLRKALELVVDGVEPGIIRDSMQLDLDNTEIRHAAGIGIFKTAASMFPSWGMIGTLVGLVLLLKALDDPSKIGPAMAVALITTFYGSLLANFICTPIANKLTTRSEEEIRYKQMIIEGVLSIQAGENPRIIEHRLKTFLSPAERREYEKQIGGEGGGTE